MKLLDGKALAAQIRGEIKERVKNLNIAVTLAVVIAGENPASQIYVRNKIRACEEAGIRSVCKHLPENCTQTELENALEELANDDAINGILLQLPLPEGLDERAALSKIPVEKDVDGFSEENAGKLALNRGGIVACTPLGVMKMLQSAEIPLSGRRAVVLGRSNTVGKPLATLLLNADATVTVCHSKTQNVKEICREADILIAAIGKAKFVTADMVKPGATVVDVGINRDENGKICGDVDYENVSKIASAISPVPGGVGPMTIAMLLHNAVCAAEAQESEKARKSRETRTAISAK
ncbi:MAG: bifunctional methylenetetrahydrofolate dehydrogenase/methenyltetrahydrofolate cyclohydrolase FolD [Candidatus Borkfalkiaceae bacterium]|nr:bifunctional methylenetetrahydrofolate dehydrogenase/methenyltetrahydrofolate cyclohydrolase FolD [Clostridia bacterium]MDY6224012.1 bifunctional methylenetetrahydrofolate dehydrogenase/methenyltetrahydrofolate cyclohydrolase FolD [Christensenellaceae bacterium]